MVPMWFYRGVGEPDFFPVNGGVDRSGRGCGARLLEGWISVISEAAGLSTAMYSPRSHDKDDLDSHYISIPDSWLESIHLSAATPSQQFSISSR